MNSSFLNPQRALLALGLMPGQTVADFDAGSGFFTRAAARAVAPGIVWAVEPRQELLPRIKNVAHLEGLDNIEVVAGSIERVGGTHLKDGTFDAVIVANSLFATDDKAAVAAEAARVLKPHGRVLVIDWLDSFGGMGPHPAHLVTEAQTRDIFAAAGFAAGAEAPAGNYHWGLVFRKGGGAH